MKCSQRKFPKSENVLHSSRILNPHNLLQISSEPEEPVAGRDLPCARSPPSGRLPLSPPPLAAQATEHLCLVTPPPPPHTHTLFPYSSSEDRAAPYPPRALSLQSSIAGNLPGVQTVQSEEERAAVRGGDRRYYYF